MMQDDWMSSNVVAIVTLYVSYIASLWHVSKCSVLYKLSNFINYNKLSWTFSLSLSLSKRGKWYTDSFI